MIHRDLFDELGDFREDFVVCEDYDLWLRFLNKYDIGFCEEVLITKYGGHEDQLSKKFKAMDYYRVKSMNSILPFVRDKSGFWMPSKKRLKKVRHFNCWV